MTGVWASTPRRPGRGGLELQERVAGMESSVGQIWGLRQAEGKAGEEEQSILYSHSLNPLWNRSMKWHSPVQKRKAKRQVMREDIAVPISAPTFSRW